MKTVKLTIRLTKPIQKRLDMARERMGFNDVPSRNEIITLFCREFTNKFDWKD